MLSRNAIMATLAVNLAIVLVTLSTTNALAVSTVKNINETQNYTISDDAVILQSLVGDIQLPMPEDVKAVVLNDRRLQKLRNEDNQFERMTLFASGSRAEDSIHSNAGGDFFECADQAQALLSVYSEDYRNWETFFKRNSLGDTMAVRYCCNLLEYVDTVQVKVSPQCRDRVRLQDQVMTNAAIRSVCRQYEFQSPECFLVRWMYWWIPILALICIALGILCVCCAMKSRRNKKYMKTRVEEKRVRTSLVNGV